MYWLEVPLPYMSIVVSHGNAHRTTLGCLHNVFTESQTLESTYFQYPCHRQGHLPLYQMLKAPSNPASNTFRYEAFTAFLRNLFQCLTTHVVKNFFLITNLNHRISLVG